MDTMNRALCRAAQSPFSDDIERAPMSSRFTCPPFNSYDGKTDPIEHVSHYIQMMSLHTHNDALMCKWVEAEALANIRDVDVKKFVLRNIVTRFGVSQSLVSNNGLQFNSRAFHEYCSDLGIVNRYSTLAYLQSNGQAKATNKAIVNGLKMRRSTGETPFSLAYRVEAVIPTEISLCSARVTRFTPAKNSELMLKQSNLLEERRESTTIRLAEYQQKLGRRYNRDIRRREFRVRDLVLRKVVGNMRDISAGKLAPTWEGPYIVTAIAGAWAYYLKDLDEKPLPRPWNAHNLKKFYH
nr:uncharacterized protein LOC112012148 [Quercus suber]